MSTNGKHFVSRTFFSCQASSKFCGTRNASTRPLTLKSRTSLQCRLALARDVLRQQSKVAKPYGRQLMNEGQIDSVISPTTTENSKLTKYVNRSPKTLHSFLNFNCAISPPPLLLTSFAFRIRRENYPKRKKKTVNVCVKQPATTRTTCSNWSEPISCEHTHTHTQENPNWY